MNLDVNSKQKSKIIKFHYYNDGFEKVNEKGVKQEAA